MDSTSSKVLVTGGTGYIGSHTCVELMNAGHEVVIVDNLCNSRPECLDAIERLSGVRPQFYADDVRDAPALRRIFRRHRIDAVIHFAGLKAVGESTAMPLAYYQANVAGALTLLETMKEAEVGTFVFSSSATVYGEPKTAPIAEDHPLDPVSPYGRSKLMVEQVLQDLHAAEPDWRIAILRYFNPVGAHESGDIGEDPANIPNNLMPLITQAAVGRREVLMVHGNDYPTPDGTGVRDYVHVVDLARGHLRAIEALRKQSALVVCNLGTGKGNSVLEVIRTFERVNGLKLPWKIGDRRPGDVTECYADPSLAHELLGWHAELGLDTMCRDAWKWQRQHPQGYTTAEVSDQAKAHVESP